MGFFDNVAYVLGFKRVRNIQPRISKYKSKAERTAEYWDILQKQDSDEYMRQMAASLHVAKPQPADPLDTTLLMLEKMDKFKRLTGQSSDRDSLDRVFERLPEIINGVGSLAQTAMQQRRSLPPARQPVEVDDDEPALAAVHSVDPDNDEEVIQMPVTPSLIANYVKSQLDGKPPKVAARWLLDQNHPAAKQMLDVIRSTPNEQLIATLLGFANEEPAFRPLIVWLQAQGQWTFDVADAIRKRPAAKPSNIRRMPAAI